MLWLEKHGVDFKKAYVGDMASETVVSHNVMVSGLFPKHMGWSDEAIRDVDNVLGYGANAIVTVGDLGYADYVKLIEADGPYPSSATTCRPSSRARSSPTSARRATRSSPWPPRAPTTGVRMGSKKKTADLSLQPTSVPWTGTYRGAGGNLPAYIKNDPRFPSAWATTGSRRLATRNDYYGTKPTSRPGCIPRTGARSKGPYAGQLRAATTGSPTPRSRSWTTRTGPASG